MSCQKLMNSNEKKKWAAVCEWKLSQAHGDVLKNMAKNKSSFVLTVFQQFVSDSHSLYVLLDVRSRQKQKIYNLEIFALNFLFSTDMLCRRRQPPHFTSVFVYWGNVIKTFTHEMKSR